MEHFQTTGPGLRLIVAYKLFKGLTQATLGGLLLHENHLGRVEEFPDRLADWLDRLSVPGSLADHVVQWLSREITPRHVALVIGVLFVDALCTSVEGLGLHFRQRWAAWLVVVATSLLVPFELYAVAKHASLLRMVILLVNVLIVVYLARQVLIAQRPHHHAPA